MFAQQHRRSSVPLNQPAARYAPRDNAMQQVEQHETTHASSSMASTYDDFGLAMASFAEWELDEAPEYGDPLDRARAVGPLAPQVDGDLDIRTEEDVARSSRENTEAWNTAFLHLDTDPTLGFTLPTVGPGADPSMAMRIGFAHENGRTHERHHLKSTGIQTLADYRQMVIQDFNFGGLVERVAQVDSIKGKEPEMLRAGGESRFIQLAMQRFHPALTVDHPDAATTVEVAKNIWSYATCGYDVEGRTDISELQGLLYLFDSHIRDSSDTNTTMAQGDKDIDWFVIPGTEDWDEPLKARRGDGRHGTATVRTTRHLMAKLDTGATLKGFDESFLLLDRTGSMVSDEYSHLSKLLQAGGIDGTCALGGYHGEYDSPARRSITELVANGDQLEQRDAQQNLSTAKDIDGTALSRTSSGLECTVEAALKWLRNIDARETSGLDEERTVSRQMVVVTDAPENRYDEDQLVELQKLARSLNMSVKVMYSFVAAAPGEYEQGGSDSYMLVDLLKVDVHNLGGCFIDRVTHNGREGTQLDWMKVGQKQGATVQPWPKSSP